MSLALSCSIGNAVSSDHAPLYLVYSLTEDRALSQRWRFQPCLFKDDKFISYFISRLDSEVLKAISLWYLGAWSLQRIRKELFLHPTTLENSSRYGQGCTRVGWSSWLPTPSLVLGWDISLKFSWVSATAIFVLGAMDRVKTNKVLEW